MTSNIEKGLSFEIDTAQEIRKHPDVKRAWRWPDTPEQILRNSDLINSYNEHRLKKGLLIAERDGKDFINTLQDVGIDIVVQKYDDTFVFIQCKNYDSSIRPENLGTFFMKMLNKEHRNKEGIVYYSNKNTISRVLKENNFDTIKFVHFQPPEKKKIVFALRDYQQIVVDECIKFYENEKKGILTMPCGTGKTIISCFVSKQYDVVIFISPLKQFAEQQIDRYKEYDSDREYLLVDSDGTRDVEEIKEFIKKNREIGKKIMMSSTYAIL